VSQDVIANKVQCGWCQTLIADGAEPISHGICESCAAAVVGDTWSLPTGEGIDDRWVDAYISTQLQDVLARRYFGTPFPKLTTEDRADLRLRVEGFVTHMGIIFGETPVLRFSRPDADLDFDGLTEAQIEELEARR
jgi:hypothetical protein